MGVDWIRNCRERVQKPDNCKPCAWGEELQASQKILVDTGEVPPLWRNHRSHLAPVGFVRFLWVGFVLFPFLVPWVLGASW